MSVSCSASGCSNKSENFSMKSFPRDPVIRQKWQENLRRVGWTPTNDSKLCEVHFLPEMWEKSRFDGKKKLKWDAIPTIFPASKNTQTIAQERLEKIEPVYFISTNSNSNIQISTVSSELKEHSMHLHPNSFVSNSSGIITTPNFILNIENSALFHSYVQQIATSEKSSTSLVPSLVPLIPPPPPPPPPPPAPPTTATMNNQAVQVNCNSMNINTSPLSSSIFSDSYVSDVNLPATLNNTDLFKKVFQYQKSYTQLLAKVNSYKEQIKNLKQKNERLVKIAKKDRHLRLLKHVFNDDQIYALERSSSRFMKWTQATLINALRLKNYCGTDGYEEILRQKIPLPSIRTLNRIKTSDPVNNIITTRKIST